jgi:hypothetical protein
VRLRDRIGHGEVVAADCPPSSESAISVAMASRIILQIILLLLHKKEHYDRVEERPKLRILSENDILLELNSCVNQPVVRQVPDPAVIDPFSVAGACYYHSYRTIFHPAFRLARDIEVGVANLLLLPHCDTKSVPNQTEAISKSVLPLNSCIGDSLSSEMKCVFPEEESASLGPYQSFEALAMRVGAACSRYEGRTLFRPREEYEYLRLLSQVAACVEAVRAAATATAAAKLADMEARTLRSRQRATYRLVGAMASSTIKALYKIPVFHPF